MMAQTQLGAYKIAARKLNLNLDEYLTLRTSGMKHCWSCEAWKALSEFDVDLTRGDKRAGKCIQCRRVSVRKPFKKAPSSQIQSQASSAVSYAMKRGLIPNVKLLFCVDCCKRAAHYHHHLGYERKHWLDVIPICVSCHRKRHYEQAA